MEDVNVNRENVVDIEKKKPMEFTYLWLTTWSRFHKSDHCRDKGQDWNEDGKRQREYEEPEISEVVGVPNFEATKEKPIG